MQAFGRRVRERRRRRPMTRLRSQLDLPVIKASDTADARPRTSRYLLLFMIRLQDVPGRLVDDDDGSAAY
jgi:hypothetical protein